MNKHVPLAVLEELKHYAESVLGNFPGKEALVNPNILLDLIHATENAYKFKRPKSVSEKIMNWLHYGPDPPVEAITELNRSRVALAEVLDWLELWGPEEHASVVQFSYGVVEDLKHSILAILEGVKTRGIPKP